MAFPNAEHIKAAQEAADYWKEKTGVYVWPSVTLAQALIESAGWTKLSGKNNGFGIKATQAERDAGNASYVWTTEVKGGQTVKVQQWFADYPSLTDAYIAHGRVLATVKAYKAAWGAKDARSFVQGIGAYATAPNYRASILAVMDRMKLEQYDQPGTPITVPAKPAPNPSVLAGASAAAGGAIVAASPHIHVPNLGMLAALGVVVVISGMAFIVAKAKEKTPAAAVAPSPEVVKLLDELAPLPAA